MWEMRLRLVSQYGLQSEIESVMSKARDSVEGGRQCSAALPLLLKLMLERLDVQPIQWWVCHGLPTPGPGLLLLSAGVKRAGSGSIHGNACLKGDDSWVTSLAWFLPSKPRFLTKCSVSKYLFCVLIEMRVAFHEGKRNKPLFHYC